MANHTGIAWIERKWPVALVSSGSNTNGPSHWYHLDRTQMASHTGIAWIERKWLVPLVSSGSNTNGPSHWNHLDRTQMASPTGIIWIEHKWPVALESPGSNTNGQSHWYHLDRTQMAHRTGITCNPTLSLSAFYVASCGFLRIPTICLCMSLLTSHSLRGVYSDTTQLN